MSPLSDPDAKPTPTPMLGRSVSLDRAAAVLAVSRRTIYNWIRSGRLHTIRTTGGSQRVLVASLRALGAGGVGGDEDRDRHASFRSGRELFIGG